MSKKVDVLNRLTVCSALSHIYKTGENTEFVSKSIFSHKQQREKDK